MNFCQSKKIRFKMIIYLLYGMETQTTTQYSVSESPTMRWHSSNALPAIFYLSISGK